MNELETFDYLIDIVDKWKGENPGRYEGSCKVLKKDTWAREIIVTPGFCISESMLKTFMMAEVLDIYAKWRTNAKISWKNMREALAGESKKKYSFCFKTLVQCFLPEKNIEAARKTNMLKMQDELVKDIENWDDIPLYLLDRIQEVFRKKLGEYWRMCSKSREEEDQLYEIRKKKLKNKENASKKNGKNSDKEAGSEEIDQTCEMTNKKSDVEKTDEEKKSKEEEKEEYNRNKEITAAKREKYRECIMAAALHEIFVRELLENCNKMLEENQMLEEMFCENMNQRMTEVMNLIDALKEQEEEETKGSKEQIENILEKIRGPRKKLEKLTVYLLTCMEHWISVKAEIQLLMLLEAKRLSILGYKIEYRDYLGFIQERNLDDRGKYNKNKKECYKQLDSDVKEIFINYLEDFQQGIISKVSYKKIFRAIEKYLKIIEQGNLDDKRRKELWDAQCLIVIPLMYKALQGKKIELWKIDI